MKRQRPPIPLCAAVTAIARTAAGDWQNVKLDEGSGWVSADFIRLEGEKEALPVVTP